MHAKVWIMFKPGIPNPDSIHMNKVLQRYSNNLESVDYGKFFEVSYNTITGTDGDYRAAYRRTRELCELMLANGL